MRILLIHKVDSGKDTIRTKSRRGEHPHQRLGRSIASKKATYEGRSHVGPGIGGQRSQDGSETESAVGLVISGCTDRDGRIRPVEWHRRLQTSDLSSQGIELENTVDRLIGDAPGGEIAGAIREDGSRDAS